MTLEGIEVAGPQLPVWREPGVDLGERLQAQPVPPALGVLADLNQAGLTQYLEVLGHRRLTQGELLDQFPNRTLARAEQVEDLPTTWLCEHLERSCHLRNITNG
jgi:hypothetical protein